MASKSISINADYIFSKRQINKLNKKTGSLKTEQSKQKCNALNMSEIIPLPKLAISAWLHHRRYLCRDKNYLFDTAGNLSYFCSVFEKANYNIQ